MKKYLLFILIIFVCVFSGCNGSNVIETAEPSEINIPVTSGDVINILMSQNQYKPIYENLTSWYDMIQEKFNIDIKIEYTLSGSDDATSREIKNKLINDYDGLILLWGHTDTQIKNLSEQGLILPLDDFIKNNEVFSSFPVSMYERFVLADNKLWGLPVMYRTVPVARLVRKDWLESTKKDLPSSLYQLYDMFKSFTYDDPNNSGKSDTYGLALTENYELSGLIDMFLANGCFVDPYGFGSISFDRHEESFEDAFLKDGALEIFEMIDSLVDDNIIRQVKYNNSSIYEEQDTDGSYYGYLNLINDLEKHSVIWHVQGTSNSYLCRANNGLGCYVISAGTKDPSATINKFLDTFYGSSEGYYSAFGGVEGIDYKVEDKQYIILSGKNSIRVLEEYAPYLTLDGYSYTDANQNEMLSNLEYLTTTSEKLYSDNIMFFTSVLDGPYNMEFDHEARKMISRLISDNISVEEALEEYKETMKKMGAKDFIDDMNLSIGKTTGNGY